MLIVMCGVVCYWLKQQQQSSASEQKQQHSREMDERVQEPQEGVQLFGENRMMCNLESCTSLTGAAPLHEQHLDEERLISKTFDDLCDWPQRSQRKQEQLRDVASSVQSTESRAGECDTLVEEVDNCFEQWRSKASVSSSEKNASERESTFAAGEWPSSMLEQPVDLNTRGLKKLDDDLSRFSYGDYPESSDPNDDLEVEQLSVGSS